jgi:hypothetical protein
MCVIPGEEENYHMTRSYMFAPSCRTFTQSMSFSICHRCDDILSDLKTTIYTISTSSAASTALQRLLVFSSCIAVSSQSCPQQIAIIRYKYFYKSCSKHSSFTSSLHALPTPLILHTNRHRRLRKLLLSLSLAACLVFLAHRRAANIFSLVPGKHTQKRQRTTLIYHAMPCHTMACTGGTYSLAATLLSVCTSRRSSLRVVWSESAGLPLVSPLACRGAMMLKGRAVERTVVLRAKVLPVRRVKVRKADIVCWVLCSD